MFIEKIFETAKGFGRRLPPNSDLVFIEAVFATLFRFFTGVGGGFR